MFKHSMILQWSNEDEGYVALIPEMPTVSAIGETPEEAASEVQVAADLYLEHLRDEGLTPPEHNLLSEYSGQLRVRMPHSLHARLATQAQIEGTSLNTYIVHLLSSGSERRESISSSEGKSNTLIIPKGSLETILGEAKNLGSITVNEEETYYGGPFHA